MTGRKKRRLRPVGRERTMLTAKEVFQMECKLLESVNKEYIEDGERSPDNDAFFEAFSAVQDLRIYLERKAEEE